MKHFLWDDEKDEANLGKHGISFDRATLVFDDPFLISQPGDCEYEERWHSVGMIGGIVIIFVAHTWIEQGDDELIRIISARKATRIERQNYEQKRILEAGR